MDPLQWMGAVRMRVQTADKNITIIHKKSKTVHQLMVCKYESIHNIAFSSENVVSSESGEKYAQVKHQLQVKTVQNSSEQKCWWILMWKNNRWWTGHYLMDWSRVDYL